MSESHEKEVKQGTRAVFLMAALRGPVDQIICDLTWWQWLLLVTALVCSLIGAEVVVAEVVRAFRERR